MALRFQRVTLIVSHQLARSDDRGVTHGPSGQTDARKADHDCRFSQRALVGFRVCPTFYNRVWLLLDSRVVDVPRASNPTFVMLSFLKPFFFNSLKNDLCCWDNAEA